MNDEQLHQYLVQQAYNHLHSDMVPSYKYDPGMWGGPTVCLYRGERDGKPTKCVVGALVPDKWYTYDLENKPALHGSVIKCVSKTLWPLLGENPAHRPRWQHLMKDLQECHDKAVKSLTQAGNVQIDVPEFRKRALTLLEKVAQDWCCTMPTTVTA